MIYVQDADYNWFFIPREREDEFYKILDWSVQNHHWDRFNEEFGSYLINQEPYDHRTKSKVNQPKSDEQGRDGGFIFRFNQANIEIPVEHATNDLLLFLSLIEIHGWSYYEKMKVNYNLALPPELESLVNMELMRKEIK